MNVCEKKNHVHNLLLVLLDHCLKRKGKTTHVLMYNLFFLPGFKWLFASKQASSPECCQRTNLNKSISVSVYKCGADNTFYVCVLTRIRTNILNSCRFKDESVLLHSNDWIWDEQQMVYLGSWTVNTNKQPLNAKQQFYYNTQFFLSSAALIACQAHQHMEGVGGGQAGTRIPWMCCMRCVRRWSSMSPPGVRRAARKSRVHLSSAVLI